MVGFPPAGACARAAVAQRIVRAVSFIVDRLQVILSQGPGLSALLPEGVDLRDLVRAQAELEAAENAAGLFGGTHPDDRRRHSRMPQRPGDRHFACAASVALSD